MRLPTLLAALLALQLTAFADPELRGTATELAQYINGIPKTVKVAGEAEVRVPAHRAVLSLRVITENRSFQEALRENAQLRAKITETLKSGGIPVERIQSSKFSSTPRFGMFGDKAKSYRVENVMRIAVQDEKEFQNATAVVDAYADVQYSGVDFEYSDRATLKQEALAKALENAKDRAKIYAEKLNLKLIPAYFSDEAVISAGDDGQKNYGVAPSSGYVTSGLREPAPQTAAMQPGESISSFGELVYVARVNVQYSVQPK